MYVCTLHPCPTPSTPTHSHRNHTQPIPPPTLTPISPPHSNPTPHTQSLIPHPPTQTILTLTATHNPSPPPTHTHTHLPGAQVPDLDEPIQRPTDDAAAVKLKCCHSSLVSPQGTLHLVRRQVPDDDCAITRTRHQHVVLELDAENVVCVAPVHTSTWQVWCQYIRMYVCMYAVNKSYVQWNLSIKDTLNKGTSLYAVPTT